MRYRYEISAKGGGNAVTTTIETDQRLDPASDRNTMIEVSVQAMFVYAHGELPAAVTTEETSAANPT